MSNNWSQENHTFVSRDTFHRVFLLRNETRLNLRSFKFLACEVTNLAVLVFQWLLTDRFLNGAFTAYGHDALHYVEMNAPWVSSAPVTDDDYADPQETIFPKVTTCTFRKHGTSGSYIHIILMRLISFPFLYKGPMLVF